MKTALFLLVSVLLPWTVAAQEPLKVQGGEDPYSIYGGGQLQEVFIDEKGRIYDNRPYQGVIPGKSEGVAAPLPPKEDKVQIKRIGFEQLEFFSRVFVAFSREVTPWVSDNFVDVEANPALQYKIFVDIDGADIPLAADRLPLDTRAFNTPIFQVESQINKKGVRLVIALKRKAGYLPVRGDGVFYVDVER